MIQTLSQLKLLFVNRCNELYNSNDTHEFTSEDFTNLTTDRIRIGRLIYFYRCKGFIIKTIRGKYTLKVSNTSNSSKKPREITLSNQIPTKYSILYGLELEFEYNKSLIGNISKSSYHNTESTKFNKYFIAEEDGSLRRNTFNYSESDTVELVSIPMTSENVMKSLESFKEDMINRYTKKTGRPVCELKDIISFNNSTGAHVHMSLLIKNGHDTVIKLRDDKDVKLKGDTKNIMTFSNIEFMKKIARRVKTRIKNELPQFYESFIKYYFRSFAKRMNIRNSSRYHEFNTNNNKTVEYRSLHLRGIQTWSELFKFYSIVTSVTDELFNTEFNKDKPFVDKSSSVVDVYTDDDNVINDDGIIDEEHDENVEEVI
jgi:hypothetical protein